MLILSHGRADRISTYQALRNSGYTGKVYIVIDNLDKTQDEYRSQYGNDVVVFDKPKVAEACDSFDNFEGFKAILYARNASWGIAKKLRLTHFVQLDDDYTKFEYRFNQKLQYVYQDGLSCHPGVRNLDTVFGAILDFLDASNADTVAMTQGGDFIGGLGNPCTLSIMLLRKAMNSFFCRTDRPFQFIGRMNEDVSTYTHKGSTGLVMLSINQVSLVQKQSQGTPGGMSDVYLGAGTYVKSFYTVMCQPSSVVVTSMGNDNPRLHHNVRWRNTVPKIVKESLRRVS